MGISLYPRGSSLCLRNLLECKTAVCSRYSGHVSKIARFASSAGGHDATQENEEFRVFEIPGLKPKGEQRGRRVRKKQVLHPRYNKMKITDDWTNIWPAASTFKYSAIPFPVRQGFIKRMNENEGVPPGRYANAELMKIPNFLHLTPAHVKKHCEALKKFCTDWPAGLETNEKCEKHFPLEVISPTYLTSGPSLRDPRARVVTFRLKLSKLNLDYHAKDKILRLLGDRYDKVTDTITLTADRCPLQKQNYDYLVYVLTALYHESKRVEPWEAEKTEADWERFYWDSNVSKKNITNLLVQIKEIDKNADSTAHKVDYLNPDVSEKSVVLLSEVQEYKKTLTSLIDDGEDFHNLNAYKESVKKLLNIKSSITV